jgi:hypothetical protein
MDKKKHKNKLDTGYVIEQFIKTHGTKYKYDKVIYNGDNIKVKIICSTHGEFEQTPSNHKRGQECPKCKGKGLSLDEIMYKLKTKHNNKYQYQFLSKDIKTRDKITIICPIHGEFEQTLNNHLKGQGCKKCAGLEKPSLYGLIKSFINVHGEKYDYNKVIYKSAHTKIKIICPIHDEFEQTPNNHKNGNGCPICNESKGEIIIRNTLIKNNIKFKPQHRFKDCKNKQPLPFDFYLPEYNTCIEFNGIQHYKPIKHFGGAKGLIKRQKNDKIKKEYCKQNNIPLITIKYNDDVINKISHHINVVK